VDISAEVDAADDLPATDLDPEALVDRSEHGLGLYLDPTSPDDPQRDERGRRVWISQAWEWILGRWQALPGWSSEFALTRFTVSTARVSDWFRAYNSSRPPDQRVRPGSFGLLSHPTPLFHALSNNALPAAPYDRDPRRWRTLPWYDRRTDDPLGIRVLKEMRSEEWEELATGLVLVDTLGDVVARCRERPEHKSLRPPPSQAAIPRASCVAARC
jgi:hypothetical protein